MKIIKIKSKMKVFYQKILNLRFQIIRIIVKYNYIYELLYIILNKFNNIFIYKQKLVNKIIY